MKFGIHLNHEFAPTDDFQERITQLVTITETARDLGFASLFGLHHYLANLPTLQPMPVLARLIPHSGTMQLGVAIYLATLEHPVQLAENAATLDQLSGGRLILGVGAGHRTNEFNTFGIPRASRWGRLEESMEVVRALWTGEPVTHHGEFYTVEGESIALVPHQTPRPQIWVGANSPERIEQAARIGDVWIGPPNVKVKWAKGNLQVFKDALEAHGKDPLAREFPIIRELYLADTDDAAVEQADPYVRNEYAQFSEYEGSEYWKTMFDDLRDKGFLFGSADSVGERISDLAEAGFDHFIMRSTWAGMPFSMAIENLHRCAEEIMPHFREPSPTAS